MHRWQHQSSTPAGEMGRMKRSPLPEELRGRAFVADEARNAGVPSRRLRAKDLARPYAGVRAPEAMPIDSTVQRCLAYLPRLTGAQFFCGLTAAELWGFPLPRRSGNLLLHVGAIAPAREPRTPGVIGHRLSLTWDDLTMRGSLPVPHPAEVWAQLGSALGLDELIVAADHVLHAHLADDDAIRAAIDRVRRRGAVDLREAIAQARAGAESPKETETRLVLVRGGLPEPELNWELRDASGRLLARLDMAYPRHRVAVEYDGRQHAERGQFERDADRWADIEANGWILIRVLAHHLAAPALVVTRTRRALLARGWMPPR